MSTDVSHDRLYLGLDLSTQQLKGVVLNDQLETIAEESISFNDRSSLVHHVQPNGFVVDPNDKRCITTPVLVFLEAIDFLFKKLSEKKNFQLSKIVAISGCGQQHGSVYWNDRNALEKLNDPKQTENSLVELFRDSFSRIECPIWMDSSTTEQCFELEQSLGGSDNLFQVTGSKAYERFTGSQIRKISEKTSEVYAKTERIQLISNFLASLLIGQSAPIDLSDGSGMNLLDIRQLSWSVRCLESCAPNLEDKLGSTLVFPRTEIGRISKYFVNHYGLNEDCRIVAFTGDNPSSYYALASDPKSLVISLGTSDTVMGSIPTSKMPKTPLDGHLLVNPFGSTSETPMLMLLLCFKNGSLVRERVREEIASKDWKQFSELLGQTVVGNAGCVGFFFDDPEILPRNVQGRFYFNSQGEKVNEIDPTVKARAILESQCLSKRLYLQRANVDLNNDVDRIVVTGGASVNADLLQILADVFGKPVFTAEAPNSGALGGALRAVDVINNKGNGLSSTVECSVAAQPRKENTSIYDNLLIHYSRCEDKLSENK